MAVYSRNANGKLVEAAEPLPAEQDPYKLNAKAPGAKLDHGKLPVSTILGDFSNALEAVVGIGAHGAEKYSLHGWLQVPDGVQRYSNALMRHWLQIQKGEVLDPLSGLMHQSHLAWNALAILELMIRQNQAMLTKEETDEKR